MSLQQGFQSADPMPSYSRQELFGLQTSMERLGFPPKQTSSFEQQREKDPSLNPSIASSSSSWRTAAAAAVAAAAVGDEGGGAFFPKASPADPSTHYYDTNEWVQPFHPLLPSAETNQLSLSLFDTNPRASDVAMEGQQLQQVEHREEWFQQQQPCQEIRRSKYLVPTQDLLNEFCSIESSHDDWKKNRKKSKGVDPWEEVGASSSSCSWNQTFQSMDILELQRRKARLLFMLEEVERRYRRYCEQMRSVVAGFEAVAGEGSSAVYAAMARKAMSRHFRCLRDGIVGQLKGTKKAMGEKEGVGGAPGATRGETPRLKALDQCLRQQKLLHHGGIMESHPWRPQRGLPERSVSILRAWLFEHFLHPYPSDVDKHILARQTGLTRSQVSNWFINARVRLWKPMVEEMYLEETRDVENHQFSSTSTAQQDFLISPTNPNSNLPHTLPLQDQKPDSDSLSSVIIGATSLDVRDLHNHHHQQLVDVDFPSYGGNGHEQSSSNNNVSLTLGLQQHDGTGGRGLSYPPAAMAVASTSQNSMFFGREPVQFTALEGDHGQNMSHPYRNLVEAHLLHDLAG